MTIKRLAAVILVSMFIASISLVTPVQARGGGHWEIDAFQEIQDNGDGILGWPINIICDEETGQLLLEISCITYHNLYIYQLPILNISGEEYLSIYDDGEAVYFLLNQDDSMSENHKVVKILNRDRDTVSILLEDILPIEGEERASEKCVPAPNGKRNGWKMMSIAISPYIDDVTLNLIQLSENSHGEAILPLYFTSYGALNSGHLSVDVPEGYASELILMDWEYLGTV